MVKETLFSFCKAIQFLVADIEGKVTEATFRFHCNIFLYRKSMKHTKQHVEKINLMFMMPEFKVYQYQWRLRHSGYSG